MFTKKLMRATTGKDRGAAATLYIDGAVPLPEKALIRRLRDRAVAQTGVRLRGKIGIGDDCAVVPIPRGHQVLVTTDFSLENVHFRRAWHPPESVGHRCLARGLSDIAAMAGDPLAVFLSLALPQNLPQKWVDRFLNGLLELADEFKVSLAGGDTAASPAGVMADIVVLGSVPIGKAVLRSGAAPGHRIYVTGELGGSAAAFDLLFGGKKVRSGNFTRHFYPTPRIAVGRFLRQKGLASAMIDLSDGLSTDLGHICEESGVGAVVDVESIPVAPGSGASREGALKFALHGGEDYELLFTAPPGKTVPSRIAGVAVRPIGVVTRSRRVLLRDKRGVKRELRPQGWEHFRT
jgi:thiamine-monophosphate kinase